MQDFFQLFKKFLHIWSLLGTLGSLKIRFLMEAKELGNKVGGKHSNKGIIVLHLFVELPSGIGYGVFAALELGLKVEVVLVGLQVRILLNGHQ